VRRPATGLTNELVRIAMTAELRRLEIEGYWHVRSSVIMPDHLHTLIALKDSKSLSSVVRLFKGRLSPLLRVVRLQWQPSFYDHCIRAGDDLLPVFLYIFLNPYRSNLVEVTEKWLGYYCSLEDWAWFGQLTHEKLPFPEWLR
jgi:REP element-mobilizing transposase RayT